MLTHWGMALWFLGKLLAEWSCLRRVVWLPLSEKLKKPTKGFKSLPKQTFLCHIPKINTGILVLKIRVPFSQTSFNQRLELNVKGICNSLGLIVLLDILFWFWKVQEVPANMNFKEKWERQRIKQSFNYKRVTLWDRSIGTTRTVERDSLERKPDPLLLGLILWWVLFFRHWGDNNQQNGFSEVTVSLSKLLECLPLFR